MNTYFSERISEIFMPFSRKRFADMEDEHGRFVYYTSAATGVSILKNNEVWLRNAGLMNDFRELRHGQDCLAAAWHDQDLGGRLRNQLDRVDPTIKDRLPKIFDDHQQKRAHNTFLLCVSEHGSDKVDEDSLGRLSMWRAYGGDTNVAFVLNNGPFARPSNALGADTHPVFYADEKLFKVEFGTFVSSIEKNIEYILDELSPENVFDLLFHAFECAVIATKHPGFAEEREWRVVFCPDDKPDHPLVEEHVVVNNVPQKIFKLPLKDIPNEGFYGATVAALIDKVIIGPTEYPAPIASVFADLLTKNGVEDPWRRISVSNIPLRR